jgi:predicted GNAT family acetyltransferase
MDIVMPKLSGIDATRLIKKANPATERIFGVFNDGTLAATARFTRHPDGNEMDCVFTLDEYRGKGFARDVVQALLDACGQENRALAYRQPEGIPGKDRFLTRPTRAPAEADAAEPCAEPAGVEDTFRRDKRRGQRYGRTLRRGEVIFLKKIKIWYVTKLDDSLISKVYYTPKSSLQTALDEALMVAGKDANIAILKDACFIIPVLNGF